MFERKRFSVVLFKFLAAHFVISVRIVMHIMQKLEAHLKAPTAVSRKSNFSLISLLERHITVFGCWKTLMLFKVFARAEQTEDLELRDLQVHFKLTASLVVKSSDVS